MGWPPGTRSRRTAVGNLLGDMTQVPSSLGLCKFSNRAMGIMQVDLLPSKKELPIFKQLLHQRGLKREKKEKLKEYVYSAARRDRNFRVWEIWESDNLIRIVLCS